MNDTIFQDLTLFTAPLPFTILMGVIGLLVGSFLNVVIYRLPIMMQRQWRVDCLDYLKLENSIKTFFKNKNKTFKMNDVSSISAINVETPLF